ncbi:MAG: alanine racemase [Formosa sp.]|nr:alanine racemase [Formosa sp.]
MPKVTETTLEINLASLKHNFEYLKSKLKEDTLFLAVVKAFAYGSEANAIAHCLQKMKVDYFAVAYIREGIALRKAGITTPILVLHPQEKNLNLAIEHCLEPSLYSLKILQEFQRIAMLHQQKNYPVHIKFNTGLNRLGFEPQELDLVVDQLSRTSVLKVRSVFSHLAASEDLEEKAFTLAQVELYKSLSSSFAEKINYPFIKHLCNTSGVINYPEAHFNMVRCGIGLYGYGNTNTEAQNFKPVATLKSVISQIHFVSKGKSVGYNRGFISPHDTKIATIPIGHADGIGRHFGHGAGVVSIENKKAVIVGNVCMDMVMVDVTDIECVEGDEVVFFGCEFSAEASAAAANTISYELITAISQRVKRVIV